MSPPTVTTIWALATDVPLIQIFCRLLASGQPAPHRFHRGIRHHREGSFLVVVHSHRVVLRPSVGCLLLLLHHRHHLNVNLVAIQELAQTPQGKWSVLGKVIAVNAHLRSRSFHRHLRG